MNQSLASKCDSNNNNNCSDDDSTESDRLSPPIKRRCQTSNSKLCLPEQPSCVLINLTHFEENKEGCKSCGKQETLLKTFNCPSLHYFCLNCIFIWTQKHVQLKSSPICLVENCGYVLKIEDLNDLPISMKDHQILVQLIDLKTDNSNDTKSTNLRTKCDKCYLYIDQHHFYVHHNECLGRSLTIPCETCYCPVLIDDYEQHMLICNNDNNSALVQFLYKHLQNPNMNEKMIKLFICSWQRKNRRTIDIYEMIEELNKTTILFQEICDRCKNTVPTDEFYFLNCDNNHSSCIACYKEHLQNQMNNDQILTCYQCAYHLQDKDLSDARLFSNEQKVLFQNYQNRKVIEYYHCLYDTEDTVTVNNSISQPIRTTNHGETSRRNCELCNKQHSYDDIFVLNCNCKICYDCFANEMKQQQQATTDELLICSLCNSPIKHNDLGNLRLTPSEIQSIQLYQQGKLFEHEHAIHFNKQKNNQANNINDNDDYDLDLAQLNQQQCLPKYWTLPMITNFTRHPLNSQSTEYKFVADKFHKSWKNMNNFLPPPPPLPPSSMPMQPSPSLSSFVSLTPNSIPTSFFSPHLIPPHINTNTNGPILNPALPPSSLPLPPRSAAHRLQSMMQGPMQPGMRQMIQQIGLPVAHLPLPPQPHPPPPQPHPLPPQPHPLPPQPHPPPSQPHPLPPQPHPPPPQLHPLPPQPHPPPPQPNPPRPQQIYGSIVSQQRTRRPPTFPSMNSTTAVNHRGTMPQIIQIERVQNQRWYKQYAAHECEFRQKLGKQTEQWLFHGCDERSSKNIEVECFNRSYAGQHATAYGQGCYFARDSVYSHSFAAPDQQGIRRMFLARVLVGNTCQGNSTMRVPPPSFDSTGDGQSIFVTYHDSQAYAEYLISYR